MENVYCRCGAAPDEVDESGYCTQCGIKRSMVLRDHVETNISPYFAAITDRGKRHNENQDDVRIAAIDTPTGKTYIIAVCDGVSGSAGASAASAIASSTACNYLVDHCMDAGFDASSLLAEAIIQAHAEVLKYEPLNNGPKDPPETTIVAAVVQNNQATIAWVGDSRAYWYTNSECGLLTRDHSWINDVVDAGIMTEEEACHSKMAHAIVRCLGGGEEENKDIEPPSIVTYTIPPGGHLMLCTDGLWNYTATPDEMGNLIHSYNQADTITLARDLVDFAIAQGGKDNITVAILAQE